MLDRLRFKCRIVHTRTVISLIGNGADDDEGYLVQVRRLRDGCAFHLGTACAKLPDQPLLFCLIRDKLISAYHASRKCLNLRIYLLVALNRQLAQLLIRLKGKGIYTRNLSDPIASISCCTASVDTTISPMLISARREPAIPVFTIALIWNRSARI